MTYNILISDFLDTQFSPDKLLERFANALEDEDIWVDLNETDAAILSHYGTGHYTAAIMQYMYNKQLLERFADALEEYTAAIMQYMYEKRDELIVEYAKTKLCAKKN